MALIDCDECGKKVSEKAKACPNCGAPVSKENILADLGETASEFSEKAKEKINGLDAKNGNAKLVSGGIYILQMLTAFFYVIPFILAVALTVILKSGANNTWLESHFAYHMKTFKRTVVIVLCLAVVIFIWGQFFAGPYDKRNTIPMMLLTPYAAIPWLWYRAIRGGICLSKDKEAPR